MMTRRLTSTVAAILPLCITGATALAQRDPGAAAPPSPTTPDNPPLWIYYLLLLVLVAGSIMISIMPSKRGHQD